MSHGLPAERFSGINIFINLIPDVSTYHDRVVTIVLVDRNSTINWSILLFNFPCQKLLVVECVMPFVLAKSLTNLVNGRCNCWS